MLAGSISRRERPVLALNCSPSFCSWNRRASRGRRRQVVGGAEGMKVPGEVQVHLSMGTTWHLYAVATHPGWASLAVLAINIAIVAALARDLFRCRAGRL